MNKAPVHYNITTAKLEHNDAGTDIEIPYIGEQGIQGIPGDDGVGVPTGGTAGQVLAKVSGTDYDTGWQTISVGPTYLSTETEINSAIIAGNQVIELAPTTINLSTPITMATGVRLLGSGRGICKLNNTTTNLSTIVIPAGAIQPEISNLSLARSATPTNGANGIHFTSLSQRAYLSNIELYDNWVNLRLGTTSYSHIEYILSDNSYSHGIVITNATLAGGLQWQMWDVLSQRSNGQGFRFEAANGGASLGELDNIKTYANRDEGVAFIGSSGNPLNSIRMLKGFHGENGKSNIYINSYGSSYHRLVSVESEIAGTSACGRNLSTAATNQGYGLWITANNPIIAVEGGKYAQNSWSGITVSCPLANVNNAVISLNGNAGLSGEKNGIVVTSACALTATGNIITSHVDYGIYCNTDEYHTVTGNNLRGNGASKSFGLGATKVKAIEVNNQKN